MPITEQDEKFFYTDTGTPIAKAGLSKKKREEFESAISSPQMEPMQLVSQADAIPAPNYTMQPAVRPATAPGAFAELDIAPASSRIPTQGQVEVAPGVWDQEAAGNISDPKDIYQIPDNQTATNPGTGTLPGPERETARKLIQQGELVGTPTHPQPKPLPPTQQPQAQQQVVRQSPVLDSLGMAARALPVNQMAAEPGKQMQLFEDSAQLYQGGLEEAKQAELQANAALKDLNARTEGSLGMIEYDMLKKRELQNLRMGQYEYDYDKALADAEELKDVNPNRLFENMSTGRKIMAGIGLILGNIGGAVTKSGFNGLQIIENAIDRDIAAQKENRQKAYKKADIAKMRLDNIAKRFDNEMAADNFKKAFILDSYKRKVDQIALQSKNAQVRAKYNQLSADFGLKIGALRQQFLGTMNQAARTAIAAGELDLKRIAELEKQTGAKWNADQIQLIQSETKEYRNDPYIKSYRNLRKHISNIESLHAIATSNPNAAQALITAFNKMLDEISVVRESEVLMTLQAGSLVQNVERRLQKAAEGTMTKEQASDLLHVAKTIYGTVTSTKQQRDQVFARRAYEFGIGAAAPLIIEQGTYGAEPEGFEEE